MTTLFFHRLFCLTSAAGTGRRMRSRPAQAHGASSMLLPHGPKTLLPNNFHLASLVATLTPGPSVVFFVMHGCAPGRHRRAAQHNALLSPTLLSHLHGRHRQTDALAAGTGARRFFDATPSRTKNSSSE